MPTKAQLEKTNAGLVKEVTTLENAKSKLATEKTTLEKAKAELATAVSDLKIKVVEAEAKVNDKLTALLTSPVASEQSKAPTRKMLTMAFYTLLLSAAHHFLPMTKDLPFLADLMLVLAIIFASGFMAYMKKNAPNLPLDPDTGEPLV